MSPSLFYTSILKQVNRGFFWWFVFRCILTTLFIWCIFNCEKFSRSSRSYLVVTAAESIVNTYVTNGFKSYNCNKKLTCYKWDPNGIQMESKWDPNGLQMGSKWVPNGIQMQQKVTYSRSYLVVTAAESIVNTYVTNCFKSSNCNKKSLC